LRSDVAKRPPSSGTRIRREHRHDRQHHPVRTVARLAERLRHLEALGVLRALGRRGRLVEVLAELLAHRVDVDLLEELEDRLATHGRREGVLAELVEQVVVAVLAEDLALFELRLARIDDRVALAVEHALQVLELHVEQRAEARRQRLEEPDVRDRRRKLDVPEALTTNLRLDHLDAAALADDPAVLHALVLAAEALVVLHRPEDARAEETVALRLEGSVVDRLGLLHFAVRPLPNLLGAREPDAHRGERERVLGLVEEAENVLHSGLPAGSVGGAANS
jgi:hypothetical protein